jgi:hypothetical protein
MSRIYKRGWPLHDGGVDICPICGTPTTRFVGRGWKWIWIRGSRATLNAQLFFECQWCGEEFMMDINSNMVYQLK